MKYRTTAPMYLSDDRYVEAGVAIGDGTPFNLPESFRPSRTMEALDEEAQEAIDALNDDNSDDFEEGIAARLERENRDLKQRIASLEMAAQGDGAQSGTEPWAPVTDTGPSTHQANIGKRPDGTAAPGVVESRPGAANNFGFSNEPARMDTPKGASSTTPPQDTIQLPDTEESSRPVPRRKTSLLSPSGVGEKPKIENIEVDGPQTGQDDPSPMVQGDDSKVDQQGDQVEEPNKNLDLKDTETFMPNNEPNAPGAPGPLGAKNQKRK